MAQLTDTERAMVMQAIQIIEARAVVLHDRSWLTVLRGSAQARA